MILVAVTLVGAVGVGWLRGGRLRNLAHVRLRASWLVIVALIAQLILTVVSARGGPVDVLAIPLLGISQVALLGFMWANRMLPGMLLIFVGFGLNAAVIISNGGMPVSRQALQALSPGLVDFAPGKHRVLQPGDLLPYLADVLPLPVLQTVVSVGDVVLAAGVGILVANLMRGSATGRRHRHAAGGDADDAEPQQAATT